MGEQRHQWFNRAARPDPRRSLWRPVRIDPSIIRPYDGDRPSMCVDSLRAGQSGWVFPDAVAVTSDGAILVDEGRSIFSNCRGATVSVTREADGSLAVSVPFDWVVESRTLSPHRTYARVSRFVRRNPLGLGSHVLSSLQPGDLGHGGQQFVDEQHVAECVTAGAPPELMA